MLIPGLWHTDQGEGNNKKYLLTKSKSRYQNQ